MKITRDNYEEFFMLYADNELDAAQKNAVEDFIAANADLRHELECCLQFKLTPDAELVFDNKAALVKPETGQPLITPANSETWFVLYADNELNATEKKAVDLFVFRNPSVKHLFELFQQAKLDAREQVVFTGKELLLHEEDDKVVPFAWWKMAAAAAAVLLVAGLFWLNREPDADQAIAKKIQPAQIAPQTIAQVKEKAVVRISEDKQALLPALASIGGKKDRAPGKTKIIRPVVAARIKTENKTTVQQEQEVPATVQENQIRRNVVSTVYEKPKTADISRPFIAAAKMPLTSQSITIVMPEEDNQVKAQWASAGNDNLEVLNTSVNTKNVLRGLFRKASRLIAKKTGSGNEESSRKGILIGGFEIAVR